LGARLRLLRRRIRGVQSTKKITSAMELIAASQIRRAQQRVEQARAYAEQITQAVSDVTSNADTLDHPLLERREDRSAAAVLVISSDRGLAGAYNANVLRTTEEVEEEWEGPQPLYIFEPSPEEILERLIPRYVETRVFAALLESAASEHAARRRAMSAATENAEDLIKALTREANQVRQTEITTVRAIAMKPTDGVVRGTKVANTGRPISVPVGTKTLGHVYNVLGHPLDTDTVDAETYWPIHRDPPPFEELEARTELLETGIKVI